MPTSVTVSQDSVVPRPFGLVAPSGCTPAFPAGADAVRSAPGAATLFYHRGQALACATDAQSCVKCPGGTGTWQTQGNSALVRLNQDQWAAAKGAPPIAGFCTATPTGGTCLLPFSPTTTGPAALRCSADTCVVTFK